MIPNNKDLAIVGIGTYLPKQHLVKDVIKKAGGDTSEYKGWEKTGIAGPDEHPGNMGYLATQKALENAGLNPSDLKIVIACAMTWDFPAGAWTIANYSMKMLKTPTDCIGFDMVQGCISILTSLDLCRNWLESVGGGYAAIICSLRYNETVDRKTITGDGPRGWGDGAGTLIVGLDRKKSALVYKGASYHNDSKFLGGFQRKYGGTRFPIAPPDAHFYERMPATEYTDKEAYAQYLLGYTSSVNDLQKKFDLKPDWLICNHVSPTMVKAILEICKVPESQLCSRGNEIGHVSSADVVFDLEKLLSDETRYGNVFAIASCMFAWGAGLFHRKRI